MIPHININMPPKFNPDNSGTKVDMKSNFQVLLEKEMPSSYHENPNSSNLTFTLQSVS